MNEERLRLKSIKGNNWCREKEREREREIKRDIDRERERDSDLEVLPYIVI